MSLLDETFECEHCQRMVNPLTICDYLGCERYSPRYEDSEIYLPGNDTEYMEEEYEEQDES